MQIRALVIDDEFGERTERYQKLAQRGTSDPLDLLPAVPPFLDDQIARMCKEAHVGFIDIFLEGPGGVLGPLQIATGTNILDLIHRENPSLPIFLVSSRWDLLNLPIYRHLRHGLFDRKQVVGGISLATLDDASECERLRLDIERAVRDSLGLAAASLGPDAELVILHLSDLQVGAGWVSGGESDLAGERLVNELFQAMPTASSGLAVSPHLLVVTGDIAERGEPAEQRAGFGLLEELRCRLAVPREGCFVVPGNHDVNLPLASADLLDYDFAAKRATLRGAPGSRRMRGAITGADRGLDRFGLAPFQEACFRFTGRGDWNARVEYGTETQPTAWFHSHAYAALGLSIIGINTVSRLGPEDPSRAEVPEPAVNQIVARLDAFRAQEMGRRDLVQLVLLHHSPWAGMGDRTLGSDGAYLMAQLERFGDSIVLFGHIHRPLTNTRTYTDHARRQALYSSPSTPTLPARSRPEDSLRGFTLLTLDRREERVTGAWVQHFEYSGLKYKIRDEGRFVRNGEGGWAAMPSS